MRERDYEKKPVSQDYKSWRHLGVSLSGYLERLRLRWNRRVWMTVSSQLILDQPIFHCGSIAKSLLYSSELSHRYCVCAHSLERNPILRSNPQAEQSKRALLLYSANPNWGGWGGFHSAPFAVCRVNERWKWTGAFMRSLNRLEFAHM